MSIAERQPRSDLEHEEDLTPDAQSENSSSHETEAEPQFKEFSELSKHYGGFRAGHELRSKKGNTKVIREIVEDDNIDGGGYIVMGDNMDEDAKTKKVTFASVVKQQDVIDEVLHPDERDQSPSEITEGERLAGELEKIEQEKLDKDPVRNFFKDHGFNGDIEIQYQVKVEGDGVPNLEHFTNYGDLQEFLKDRDDKNFSIMYSEELNEWANKLNKEEQDVLKRDFKELNRELYGEKEKVKENETQQDTVEVPSVAEQESTREESRPRTAAFRKAVEEFNNKGAGEEVLSHTERSQQIIESVKEEGYEFNQAIKSNITKVIDGSYDEGSKNSVLLKRYVGMMEKDLDYASDFESDQSGIWGKVKGVFNSPMKALTRLELRAHMAGVYDPNSKSGTFKEMGTDMKYVFSLFSRKPRQEIIDTRAKAILAIEKVADNVKDPAQKSLYLELAKEYKKLNQKDKELFDNSLMEKISRGISSIARKLEFSKKGSEQEETQQSASEDRPTDHVEAQPGEVREPVKKQGVIKRMWGRVRKGT